MKKAKKKTFNIQVQVNVMTDITVTADSMEEALEFGRSQGVRDVVDFEGDYIDGDIKVTGVFEG